MTSEKAVKVLKSGEIVATTCDMKDYTEAREMAIKALEQEPCEDAVSRQTMFKWLESWKEQNRYYHPYTKNKDIPMCEVVDMIQSAPSVTPTKKPYKVKRAFEMGWEKGRALMGGRCECGQYISDADKYCRKCGRPLDWGDIFGESKEENK